jgi:hypothetical protein
MYGTTCFKCGGAGATLTKRGKVAQVWLAEKRKVSVSDLKVGDEFWFDSIFGPGWVKVTETAEVDPGQWALEAVDKKGEKIRYVAAFGEKVRKRMTNDAAKALKTAALEFQGTLTKTGTIRKKSAKALAS